ncbi:ribonuclease H-like domain-containing protein [Tanacetum coccineum]
MRRNTSKGLPHSLFAVSCLKMNPRRFKALEDERWFEAMLKNWLQISDLDCVVVRNKARLVAQGHRQEEGIDYDEVFAPMARIEAIRIFLAFASYMGFIVYQMDVKSAFLYGKIDEGDTPIETHKPLVKDEEASDVDVHLYRSMIGSLMYLTASRPDIMFGSHALSSFSDNLKPQPIPSPPQPKVKRQHRTQTTLPLPDLFTTTIFPDSIPRGFCGIMEVKSSSDRSLFRNEGGMTTPKETEDAHAVGRTTSVHEEKKSVQKRESLHNESEQREAQKKAEIELKDMRRLETYGQNVQQITSRMKRWPKGARGDGNAKRSEKKTVEKLQEEEREMYTIEQRAKFLHDTIAAQRRFLAQQRSKAIKNKPPSRNQLRNQMMTYLKHVGGKKHSDLKTKGFEEIKALYDKIKRSDDSFIAIGSAEDEKVIKEINEQVADASKKRVKKDDSIKGEIKEEEGTRKRKLATGKEYTSVNAGSSSPKTIKPTQLAVVVYSLKIQVAEEMDS